MQPPVSRSPSPLDRPGLDDPPLREWVADAEDGASLGLAEGHSKAIRDVVTPVTFQPDATRSDRELEDERPERLPERNPISIELVRGADGTGANADVDAWHVLVDGVRCTPVRRPDAMFDEEEKVYHLPLPYEDERSLYDARLDGGPGSVRPLAFGVRVESEALRPAKVELVVEQVIESGDTQQRENAVANQSFWLHSGERYGDEQVSVTSTQTLSPYTPLDVVAPCITTPYPFRTPATSALALLHAEEKDAGKRSSQLISMVAGNITRLAATVAEQDQQWRQNTEFQAEINRTVDFTIARDSALRAAGRTERGLRLDDRQAKIDADREAARAAIPLPTGNREVASIDDATRENRRSQNAEARKREATIKKTYDDQQATLDKQRRKYERDGVNTKLRMYVPDTPFLHRMRFALHLQNPLIQARTRDSCTILGGTMETVVDLEKQFEKLDMALNMAKHAEGVSSRPAVAKDTAYVRVQRMRKFLLMTGETKAARLLETLLLSKPNFVSYQKGGRPEWAKPEADTGSEESYYKWITGILKKEKEINSILLDRMEFSRLRKSSCRVRFRLRVTESGEATPGRDWLFEASSMHGFLANASYNDTPATVERVLRKMRDFYSDLTADLEATGPLTPLWDRTVPFLRAAPDVFNAIATEILDFWQSEASFERRMQRASMARTASYVSAAESMFGGASGDLLARMFGENTTLGAQAISAIGAQAFNVWLQTASDNADAERSREASIYAQDRTVRTLRYLTAPGMSDVLKAFLEEALPEEVRTVDSNSAKPLPFIHIHPHPHWATFWDDRTMFHIWQIQH